MSSCSFSLSFSVYFPHSLPYDPNLSLSHVFTEPHIQRHTCRDTSQLQVARNPSPEHFSKSFPSSFSFYLMHFTGAKRLTEIKNRGSKFASSSTLSNSKRTTRICKQEKSVYLLEVRSKGLCMLENQRAQSWSSHCLKC